MRDFIITQVSVNLLRKQKHSVFETMLSGEYKLEIDEDNRIKIDRDPILFNMVIKYIRTKKLPFLEDKKQQKLLEQEFDFWGIYEMQYFV